MEQTQFGSFDELVKHKKEIEESHKRLRFTEKDAELICSSANELTFTDGQVIFQAGEEFQSVFRIKSGNVKVFLENKLLCTLPPGWFLGDKLFLGSSNCYIDWTVYAEGPVTLLQLNLPFVKRLLASDRQLNLRLYRNLANKIACMFFFVVGHLHSIFFDFNSDTVGVIQQKMISEIRTKKKTSRRNNFAQSRRPYRVFELETYKGRHCHLRIKKNKVQLISPVFGIKHKKNIYYTELCSLSKLGDSSITFLYGKGKALTLVLKDEKDRDELHEYLLAVTEALTAKHVITPVTSPISSPKMQPRSSEKFTFNDDDLQQEIKDRELLLTVSETRVLRKGQIVVEEGDLFQRIYQVVKGTCNILNDGRPFAILPEGAVFGESTLMFLRPMPHTIIVSSDEAIILTIPQYKIAHLTHSNTELATRLYKNCAKMLLNKVAAYGELQARNAVAPESVVGHQYHIPVPTTGLLSPSFPGTRTMITSPELAAANPVLAENTAIATDAAAAMEEPLGNNEITEV